jgi:Uma2 family endonuclease
MFEIGVLDRTKRYELLDGEIVMMSPSSPEHGWFIRRLNRYFVRQLPDAFICSPQLPVVIGDHSEPEPDLAVIRQRADDYRTDHPQPGDVVLLVDVSKTSLTLDLGKKLKLYAKSGVAEYWVVDIVGGRVIIHREPNDAGYRLVEAFGPAGTISPLSVPECQLDLGWLFR